MYTVPQLTDHSPSALAAAAKDLIAACEAESAAVGSEADYKAYRDRWMARKNGILTQINDGWLKAAPKEAKRDVGAKVNEIKNMVEQTVEGTLQRLLACSQVTGSGQGTLRPLRMHATGTVSAPIDITLPGIRRPIGVEHPVIRTMNDMVGIFKAMGYSVGVGPEIETDYYNFESLNFPPNHPARDTQDTIFISGQEKKPQRDRLLLRTHTSPVQIRAMEKQRPPVRIVIPGKVHRNDEADATHSPVFHQIEGLCVDTNITFSDLKGTLDHAMKSFFGAKTKTRFTPSFFPFTEPSAEVAVSCFKCGGSGRLDTNEPCRFCKSSGWVELLGCGMVDPNVFDFVGYDPEQYSGFAFGMGVERLALALYDIDDIQLFYHGDVRFLEQFG
jgi:phenylalanyl-tRNA synthetase alpha chain